jgi:sodium transport system ATP-binding protein
MLRFQTPKAAMIEIVNLTKKYNDTYAVKNLDIQIPTGTICGFLGRNGAGKTTTMRMLATLIAPTSGTAKINGFDIQQQPLQVRSALGIVNGGMKLPDRLTVKEALEYQALLQLMPTKSIRHRIQELADQFEINFLNRLCKDLSTGMAQRALIARAILSNPQVLLLDEASNGLDIAARQDLFAMIRSYANQGNTVMYSTHILSELEDMAQLTAVIHHGELIEFHQGFQAQSIEKSLRGVLE